jgi:hypothetical protein
MTAGRRLAALLLPALALGLLGCRAPAAAPPPNLEIPRFRWNADEGAGVVRVAGEVVNRGQTTVPQIEVKADLLGTSGESRGENITPILRDLAPGEKRPFALNIKSHGGVSRVDLTWQVPEGKR